MFNPGSRPTITKSVVESAESGLESADSNADPPKISVWVRAFSLCGNVGGGEHALLTT